MTKDKLKLSKLQTKFQITLAYKIYFIVLTSVACCALFIGIFSYYQSKKMVSENIGNGLKQIAQTAVLSINAEDLESITSADDDSYVNIKNYLLNVKSSNRIVSPLYILKRMDFYNAALVVTTAEGAPIGAYYGLNNSLKQTFNTSRSNYSSIYTDKSGTWISAYAPIISRKGEIAGVLVLDYRVEYYITQLRYRLSKTLILCVLGFVTGTLLGIPLVRPILGSITTLRKAASEIEKGDYDYEVKPQSSDEIGYLAQTFENMRRAIKNYTEKLKESWLKEKEAHLESIKALSEAIAVREPYTKGHIERVSRYAELVARELGLSNRQIEIIKYGCVIHDIGKIGIDINIINKTSELTPLEYENIKQHPYLGAKIIKGVRFLEQANDIILYHHERYDGKGYPKGLKAEEIPIAARIVALADVYDAMTSDRPYREKSTTEEIIARIKRESGKRFDPKVVEAFLKIKNNSPHNG